MAGLTGACAQTVALTFDDAPDATNTARVLDALKNAGVKATFFVNSHNQLDVAKQRHRAGARRAPGHVALHVIGCAAAASASLGYWVARNKREEAQRAGCRCRSGCMH